jgi:hypothetical protein
MNQPDQLTINGCVYVKQTTEPVNRERQTFYVHKDLGVVSHTKSWGSINCTELFPGDIVISKWDFDAASIKVMSQYLCTPQAVINFLREELFK